MSKEWSAIAVADLRKRYGEVQALDGVSFSVREGEVFGLLGPNGAGKSTTVRVLVTLTHPDGGLASVSGHDVLRDPETVRRVIGYVPQDSGVDQFGTGRENLTLQGRVQGMRGGDLRSRVDELLELVGIADAADRSSRRTRAGCGVGSTSRSGSSTGRACSSSTSRRPVSTRRRASRCGRRFAARAGRSR